MRKVPNLHYNIGYAGPAVHGLRAAALYAARGTHRIIKVLVARNYNILFGGPQAQGSPFYIVNPAAWIESHGLNHVWRSPKVAVSYDAESSTALRNRAVGLEASWQCVTQHSSVALHDEI